MYSENTQTGMLHVIAKKKKKNLSLEHIIDKEM